MDVSTYPCPNLSQALLVSKGPITSVEILGVLYNTSIEIINNRKVNIFADVAVANDGLRPLNAKKIASRPTL